MQVGDPFTEKLLIEACLELMATDAIVAIQDMGAAGLTSSSVEMASKGGAGIRLDMNKVPCREEGMTPYEMMLSESQERMLIVLKPGREAEAEAIFHKWELDFAVIGEVTDTGHMVLEWNGEVAADIPLGPLADDAPLYDRPHMSLDEYKAWAQVKPLGDVPESTDIAADLLKLMGSPNIASRRWIYEQYDQQVGGDTVQRPGGDAAVVRVHGSKKALAMTTDVTPRYCYADPYEGGKQAIAEAYRNLCAVGAKPLAVTNCLNFGNPQRPEIMAQFVECLRGMGDACRALDFPIVSGNVSLYNESKATGGGSAILPTPAIGGVGLLDDWEQVADHRASRPLPSASCSSAPTRRPARDRPVTVARRLPWPPRGAAAAGQPGCRTPQWRIGPAAHRRRHSHRGARCFRWRHPGRCRRNGTWPATWARGSSSKPSRTRSTAKACSMPGRCSAKRRPATL